MEEYSPLYGLLVLFVMAIGLIAVFYYIFTFGISHLLDYRPTSKGIGFYLFRFIKIFELKFAYIENCQACKLFAFSWIEKGRTVSAFFALTIGGWPRWTKVVLTLNKGPFRYVVLFPQDPKAFVEEVRRNLNSGKV